MKPVLEDIIRVVALQLGRRDVDADAGFMEELGAESAELVNIIATLEEKYQVMFAEEEIPRLKTTRHLFDKIK